MIGILAYGSLIADPGDEIRQSTERIVDNVLTPFPVEYARRSHTRAGAPTLVPVPEGCGAHMPGAIFVLKPDTETQKAKDLLFRRERHKEADQSISYDDAAQRAKKDALVIETLRHFQGFGEVYFTSLQANFTEILDPNNSQENKAALLARAAVESVTPETFKTGLDGIQYLQDNLKAGIETPLSKLYEAAILEMADNAPDLSKARLFIAREKGIIP